MKFPRQTMTAAALSLGLFAASSASAASYSALDLGAADSQFHVAINASGQVVATLSSGDGQQLLPTIINPNGVVKTVPVDNTFTDYHAVGINDAGQVAVYSAYGNNPAEAFWARQTGGIIRLGSTSANDINNGGQVAGFTYVPNSENESAHAYVTSLSGIGIMQIDSPYGSSYAVAVNDSGQVAGYMDTQDYTQHAFITGRNGVGVTDLGVPDGSIFSFATDINASGQVSGYSITEEGLFRGFITGANGVGFTDIGALGQEGTSFASGINASGQVVGFSFARFDDNISQAFVTGDNGVGMTDLNTLVTLPGEVLLQDARAINDAGQIVAFGGDGHLYLLSPVPEPGTHALMLLGLAGVVFVARQRVKAPAA